MKPKKKQKVSKKSHKEDPLKKIAGKIISAAMEVHSQLGPGLLENVYEEALAHEFTLNRIGFERQKEINVIYKGKVVGWHRLDYLVGDEVLVEVKAMENMHRIYEEQLLTSLRAANKKVGLLINFNVGRIKDGIKVFSLDRK